MSIFDYYRAYAYETNMHSACYILLSNCPSICPSVTHWYCAETAEPIAKRHQSTL